MRPLLLGAAVAVVVAGVILYDHQRRRVLVPGDQPVSEEQVRAALRSEGYAAVEVTRSGGYFEVTATKDAKHVSLEVDAATGRVSNEPFHDAEQ